jgi:Gram-negative bacterial TonB protein C-terminal
MAAATFACVWKNMNVNDQELIELLQRWQAGTFTRSDEAALRRLRAEGDAFVREAIDGYFLEPEADQAQVLSKFRQKTVAPIAVQRPIAYRWWAAAAALAVLLVAVWWVLPAPTKAIVKEQPSAAAPTVTETSNQPTVALDSLAPAESVRTSTPPAPLPSVPAPTQSAPSKAPQIDVAAPSAAETAPPIAETEGSTEVIADMAEEQVPSELSKPMPDAKESRDRLSKKEEQLSPTDVPNAVTPGGPAGNAAMPARAVTPSEPKAGWELFNSEMRRQARLTAAARAAGINKGVVKLQFTLNTKGEVQKVDVLSTLGYGCDQIAIDLVRQYQWTGTTGTVKVVFQ